MESWAEGILGLTKGHRLFFNFLAKIKLDIIASPRNPVPLFHRSRIPTFQLGQSLKLQLSLFCKEYIKEY
jgi:hypothetical protein